MCRRALAIVEKVHGPTHPDVSSTLHILAKLMMTQARRKECPGRLCSEQQCLLYGAKLRFATASGLGCGLWPDVADEKDMVCLMFDGCW